MRRFLVVLSLFVFAATLTAQVRTGNIYGKITDSEGNPLPGVSVQLTGPQIAPLNTVSTAVGIYRLVALPPGSEYNITAELSGFKKETRTGIIVSIGGNAEINLTMEVGTIEEQVTVVARTPVVDVKKTTVVTNVDRETMQSLPSARDPWVMMQLAPAIMVDRENVGGNESGQQSGFIARGDTSGARVSGNQGANNIWAVDGIDVTDPAALGGSAGYYDFDMFEELNITVGGAADVTIQTGGVSLNMVTRRGGNRLSLAGRFYLTDNYFQGTNITPELQAQGVLDTNKIIKIKDYGFNAGGPLIKDTVWWWGSYGVQDIHFKTLPSRTGLGTYTPPISDRNYLDNYNFKLNAQILANNRFEFLITAGAKEKIGRDSSPATPEGNHQTGKYPFGSPIVKLQDEHVFGNNLYLSAKYTFNDAGFMWRPVTDYDTAFPIVYDNTQSKYLAWRPDIKASWGSYGVERPRNNAQLQANYFNDTLFGMSHEFKAGVEYSHKIQRTYSNDTGNIQGFNINTAYNTVQVDTNLDGTRSVGEMAGWMRTSLYRRGSSYSIAEQWAAYLQDTIVKGNFTLSLGLRFDKQWSSAGAYSNDAIMDGTPAWDMVFPTDLSAYLSTVLTDVDINAVGGNDQVVGGKSRPYQWRVFSPRIGLTWDITGDGKTVARLALSQYGDIMGVGWNTKTPLGTGGTINYWWNDVNANKMMDWTELYWANSSSYPVTADRYKIYPVFSAPGVLSDTAVARMTDPGGFYASDLYRSGNVSGFKYTDPDTIDYVGGVTSYFQGAAGMESSRTREFLVTLEREILTDFSASVNFSYRKFDHDKIGLRYYPTEHADQYPTYTGPEIIDPTIPPPGGGTWYVEAGTIPDTYHIGGTFTFDAVTGNYVWTENTLYPVGDPRRGREYASGNAAGRPYYMAGPNYPSTATNYSITRQSDNFYSYYGVDLILNKRLSNKWMMNASFTWQAQTTHWGNDWWNETNKWCQDGQPYGDWGGAASGKQAALMYTRWMVKFTGLYQLPWGFNVSATFNAREGWKVPQYFTIYDYNAPNSAVQTSTTVYKDRDVAYALPTMYNLTLRLEKKINIGAGRMYIMADMFNVLNSNMPIRSYPWNDGTVYLQNNLASADTQRAGSLYNYTGLLSEVLNPRITRLGVRFEF